MKKNLQLLFVAIILCICTKTNAQITTFPSTEGFETAFDTGMNVTFIPNWIGNQVRATFARIFQDTVNFHGGTKALGAIPINGFNPQVVVDFDLTGVSNMTTNFWAKSEVNTGGTRGDVVYVSASVDGGVTYGPATQIGDSLSFPNSSAAWTNYFYPFPSFTNNQPSVRLKIEVSRANGAGTTARFVADDFTFIASTVDSFPPTVIYAKATALNTIEVQFSEPVSVSGENFANYTGLTVITNAVRNITQDKVTLTLAIPLTLGQHYAFNVANISDQNSNAMDPSQNFTIVFNDNTGNVKMTEIMYNQPGNDSLEFVEITNLDANPINIGGWKFSDGLTGLFPSNLVIAPHQYLVFAKYPQLVDAFFSITSIAWDATGGLNNGGEKLSISNSLDVVIDSVTYGIVLPWDTLANGQGHSLTLCNEAADNDLPQSWTHSLDSVGVASGAAIYASPGTGCLTVGVEENNVIQNNSIAVQPNPSADKCEILFAAGSNQSVEISLWDINGRELLKEHFNAAAGKNQYFLNTLGFENGIYILRAGNYVAKVAVQH